ncbi:MAG: hypothetical protein R3E89_13545 [Thiolinea sp.]
MAQATAQYEQALRYYVAGLQYAGSPYAYHSIGSTLLFRASAYAQVRGFPKRAAGEDFHLLNKLAKLGHVVSLTATPIQLQARISDRVPFGTGMSTARIMNLNQHGEAFCYYHPQSFAVLRQVLTHFGCLWAQRNQFGDWLAALLAVAQSALQRAGLPDFVTAQARQCRTQAQFDAQVMRWFDALKTLQFIHRLRDLAYPDVPLQDSLQLLPSAGNTLSQPQSFARIL